MEMNFMNRHCQMHATPSPLIHQQCGIPNGRIMAENSFSQISLL